MMGPEHLGQLVDKFAAALALYARQWCSTPEDVVQEAFLKLFMERKQPSNTVAWLYRVVRNGAVSAGRKAQRRHRHETTAAERSPAWFMPGESIALDVEAATNALKGLPIEQREIIVAHLWGGLTFAEIAEFSGGSSSSAHRNYAAGLAALRERVGASCPKESTTLS